MTKVKEKEAKEEIEVKTDVIPENLLSVSKLAFRFNLDRATVNKRIAEVQIKPYSEKEKEKLYELTELLESVLNDTSKPLDIARLKKMTAETELKDLELQKKKGEVLPVNEVKEAVREIFSNLHKEITMQIPKKIASKIKKAKTIAEIQAILTTELNKPFNILRVDYPKFLNE